MKREDIPGQIDTQVDAHYRTHLAPVYLWMAGGVEAALARGTAEIEALFPDLAPGTNALDLGAGFGMHAIPLARRGCTVLALDSSRLLLDELAARADPRLVRTVEDDLLSFPAHLAGPVDLILCMGDTLNHLCDLRAVEDLFAKVADALRPGGQFVATFRDYSKAALGPARFIPVRSDADRILTCFLEYGRDFVDVHDVLHERDGSQWKMRVSAYRKLRLSPARMAAALRACGLEVRLKPGPAGMVEIVASSP